MPDLTSVPVTELLDALASTQPVPAGGSAAALAGAAGASLLLMGASLPKTRTGAPDEATALADAAGRLRPHRDALTSLIQRDTDAYSSLIAAFRLPKGTEDEQRQRRDAIQEASRAATEAPLDIMRASHGALELGVIVASHMARAAAADVAVGVELLLTAARSAAGGVDANLGSLKDVEYATRAGAERRALEEGCVSAAAGAQTALR